MINLEEKNKNGIDNMTSICRIIYAILYLVVSNLKGDFRVSHLHKR